MEIKLLDWEGKSTVVDVGNLTEIGAMRMQVITGDEVLTVIYKDYTIERFDSSSFRDADIVNNEYEIYNIATGVNLLNNHDFLNRKNSYDW